MPEHPAEFAAALAELEERRALLERLTRIQRSITSRAPLPDVLEGIVSGARELLGDTIVAFRRVAADDPTYADIVCASGVDPDTPFAARIRVGEGAGGRAIAEERLIVMNDYSSNPFALGQFADSGLQAAMAAPVTEDGETIGSLVVASFAPRRRYSAAEQEMLLAFAEHASIAMTDARIVESLRVALRDARHDAMHDVLTRLPNRALLRDRLSQASSRATRHGTRVGLIFVDLDGFKHVNDSLGHDVGDKLLVAVAARFLDAVRDTDTVARLGGDEFAVLIEDIESFEDASDVAERLLEALIDPLNVDGHDVQVCASIGIAMSDADASDSRTLLRNADLAMYEAKRGGGNKWSRFVPDMHRHTVHRLHVEQALRQALAQNQLVLHYQPILELATGRIVALEALARWQHPERGLIPPAEFIHIAESGRLITALGEWVLRTACTEAAYWPATVSVAVNVSPRQVDPRFVRMVRAVLSATGLPAERLKLEVTEGVAMADSAETIAVLRELHELGVQLAIDDFGTGYSSLARLRALPVDVLKIDRSFVEGMHEDSTDCGIVAAVVALAHAAGMRVIAEGVETEAQHNALVALGADFAQGYRYGRPMAAAEFRLVYGRTRRHEALEHSAAGANVGVTAA